MVLSVFCRYLEDVVPLIRYQPPAPRGGKKQTDDTQKAFWEEYKSLGLDESSIAALHNITRSDRIDFQVILVYYRIKL